MQLKTNNIVFNKKDSFKKKNINVENIERNKKYK